MAQNPCYGQVGFLLKKNCHLMKWMDNKYLCAWTFKIAKALFYVVCGKMVNSIA